MERIEKTTEELENLESTDNGIVIKELLIKLMKLLIGLIVSKYVY